MAKKHILLQGFGSFPLNFAALVARARELGDNSIEWSIVCTTGHYVEMFEKLIGKDAVLYLHSDMQNFLNTPDLLDQLGNYNGNIYRNIESEKRFTKHKKSTRQLRTAAAMYLSMKAFVLKRRPTHILFGQIEGLDGMTLISLGRELSIPALVPTHTRHLGETFFSPDHLETLPVRPVGPEHRAKAADFMRRFNNGATPASAVPPELLKAPDKSWPLNQSSLVRRTLGVLKRLAHEPEMREPDVFRASLFLNFPILANLIWNTRAALNQRIRDIDKIEQLPKHFAYYPLQVSPESSINTPAPFYIDQIRAIDAIRFALPSDMLLVVKEHPAFIGLRKARFLRSLQNKAGILLARYDLPSDVIAERAAITFSVSGSAVLEAYLKGRPSLTLGGTFFASFLGGPASFETLEQRVCEALVHRRTDQEVAEAVARVYAASAPFITGAPFDHGSQFARYALNKTNIDNFYHHLQREIELV